MLTAETARQFSHEWIAAWNSHEIDRILAHYEDQLEFISPMIIALNFNSEGVIRSKADLKKYFEIGLRTFPDLHFEFRECFAGYHSLVIYYQSVNGKLATEAFEFNDHQKVKRVLCHYGVGGI